ncbi:GNAT family N-acetyltransferase [Mycetohabitans sp. B6]|nr:GNAT family N-acetyltransferase [Mycetohabitans sp. B6]
MSAPTNRFGQPIGRPLADWSARAYPQRVTLHGRYCRLEPLQPDRHASALYGAYAKAPDDRDWTYLAVGPFDDEISYRRHAESAAASTDPLHFAVINLASGLAVGTLALMRIDPTNGVIEVGSVAFSPELQRTPASTEAQYLLMKYVFDTLGYRRYEWKCDNLNAPSRKAAVRLGFRYEGTFRQAVVYKERSRDTAWFSIIDSEWSALAAAFDAWLSPQNFDAQCAQRLCLTAIRAQQAATRRAGAPVTVRPLAASRTV